MAVASMVALTGFVFHLYGVLITLLKWAWCNRIFYLQLNFDV